MRSDFVATVSHELRTPLASIHGAAITLSSRGPQLGAVLHERLLAIVVEQSERLSELVEQILLAAQLDSGGLRLDSERFDAAVLARKVIASSRPRIPTGLTVSLAAPPPEFRTRSGTWSEPATCSATCSTTRSSTRRTAARST